MRRNRADKSSWRFCRVGSFVDKNDVKFWLVSSFDLCQVLMPPNFTYELSLEIQKYRLQCGRIYEISERIYEIMGKSLGRYCLRRMRCGRIFGHMRFEALESRSSRLWMRTHRGCVFICPAAGGGYITFLVLLKQKIDAFPTIQNRQNSIKIHLKSLKIDKNSF